MVQPLVSAIRLELKKAGDPEKAPAMQRYMRSAMPFRGVQTPVRREILRRLVPRYPLGGAPAWKQAVLDLWREAAFREERYAAIALSGHALYQACQTPRALPLYQEMIVTGAWWDYVDTIASHQLGGLLRSHPGVMRKRILAWSRDSNLWKRRAAILCQLGYKDRTDLDLLYACILPNLQDPDFFIQKAIGWALRQYAWIDPVEVRRYVREQDLLLSPLSQREALRNLRKRERGGS
jgi:3-methyladenine DNA glycosylase AlkD